MVFLMVLLKHKRMNDIHLFYVLKHNYLKKLFYNIHLKGYKW